MKVKAFLLDAKILQQFRSSSIGSRIIKTNQNNLNTFGEREENIFKTEENNRGINVFKILIKDKIFIFELLTVLVTWINET